MNKIPDEILLHLFTYINIYSTELIPLMEINKHIRQILYFNKYTMKEYPCLENESVASVCNSFLSFVRILEEDKRDFDEFFGENNNFIDLIEDEIYENEIYEEEFGGDEYLHFTPF